MHSLFVSEYVLHYSCIKLLPLCGPGPMADGIMDAALSGLHHHLTVPHAHPGSTLAAAGMLVTRCC